MSSPRRLAPGLQFSQSGLWIFRTDNRWQLQLFKFLLRESRQDSKARWTETIDDGEGEDCSKVSSLKATNSQRTVVQECSVAHCAHLGQGTQTVTLGVCKKSPHSNRWSLKKNMLACWIKAVGASAHMMKIRPETRRPRGVQWSCSSSVRQVEFSSTVKAHPVRAVFDREHTAEVTVAASKNKLEDTQEKVHKSCARWRRSQLPLASSHSSRERTLVRARAIAQSAAP